MLLDDGGSIEGSTVPVIEEPDVGGISIQSSGLAISLRKEISG